MLTVEVGLRCVLGDVIPFGVSGERRCSIDATELVVESSGPSISSSSAGSLFVGEETEREGLRPSLVALGLFLGVDCDEGGDCFCCGSFD